MRNQTTSEVEAGGFATSPEYVNSKGLRAIFGISRSMGYALIDNGSVKSVCLRQRGASRGKRLWVADSVRGYLNSCIDKPADQHALSLEIEHTGAVEVRAIANRAN